MKTARPEDIERLYEISHANDGTTICGMGDAAGYATVGILNKYRDEFEKRVKPSFVQVKVTVGAGAKG